MNGGAAALVAQINGYTVHHFGDEHKQSMKCRALRVIIIDEVPREERGHGEHLSTVGAVPQVT